ncbi:MAG: PepSY-associated TM helix domain-containing protein [Hyphomicrobiaceae bacterium]
MSGRERTSPGISTTNANRRAFWMRQFRTWHWISGAITLITTLLFAITGITLNHSANLEGKPVVTTTSANLGAPARVALKAGPAKGVAPVPGDVAASISAELGVDVRDRPGEWSTDEVYVSLPRAGGDAWLAIDRDSGTARYEMTSRGWIAYLNDLHKGRNTGVAWSFFIDVFAVACIVFCATGLLLLQMYSAGRPLTWPLVGLGIALPIVLAVLLIH